MANRSGNAAAARILATGSTGTRTIAAGGSTVLDARGMMRLTIIQNSSNTVTTLARATGLNSTGGSGAFSQTVGTTAGAAQRFVLDIDWPFYQISNTTEGACGWSLV